MPQATQIVPKYLHSHVETYINDYTQFDDSASTPVDNNNKFICVFRSGKGPDNVLLKKDDLSDFIATYGNSNFAKYGQPLMMPIAMLTSGSATVYSMRVMPDDAFAANSILLMQYRFDEDTKKMVIRYRTKYLDKAALSTMGSAGYKTSSAFKKQLELAAQAEVKETMTDEKDGKEWKQIPIAVFRMAGRGVYGNNYRWRITRNFEYENDYGIMMYTFECINAAGSGAEASYVGSIVSSSQYRNITLINDILDNEEKGAVMMDVDVLEDYVNEAYDEFKVFLETLDDVPEDLIPTNDTWDPFFGFQCNSTNLHPNMEVIGESTDTEDIGLSRAQGIALMGGDDGAFGSDNPTDVFNATNKCYVDAFSGEYDSVILSSRRSPCDAILDANYNSDAEHSQYDVKGTLYNMALARNDALLYLDAGTETTKASIDNLINDYARFNSRNAVKEFQHYTVKDPGTMKKCEVTVTYFYAQKLPTHYQNYGSWVPFVKARCELSGHIKNTLEPAVDDLEMELKEKLYVNRFNYFETIDENVYQRAAQNTAQMIDSDLMEENNMNTLFALKKQLERDCWNSLYDFTSVEDRARFSESEQAKFASWVGSRLDTLSIIFDANEWEMERSIVHCYVSVRFRNMMKRVIIEIDVNKRNFEG